jgi:hypothetical protein
VVTCAHLILAAVISVAKSTKAPTTYPTPGKDGSLYFVKCKEIYRINFRNHSDVNSILYSNPDSTLIGLSIP